MACVLGTLQHSLRADARTTSSAATAAPCLHSQPHGIAVPRLAGGGKRRGCVCCAAGSPPAAAAAAASAHHHGAQQHAQLSPQRRSSGGGGGWAIAACSGPAPSDASPSLGWGAGFSSSFRLGERLGAGSFGTVHRAVHRLTGRSYAVKVLHKRHGAQLDTIQREVSTWQQAQEGSRFVAKLEGLFEDEHHAYIVQELCAGGTLKDLLDARGACSEAQAAAVMHGVLDVLVECHSRGICYGDLKPANIMFRGGSEQQQQQQEAAQQQEPQQLQVRAIDFGQSQPTNGRALTQACGSPLYMAPEVALQRYGVGVDVWAAGVLLYQMLTGRLPFWRGKTLDEVAKLPTWQIVADVRTAEVSFPRDLWHGISADAQQLVARMLDRDPATRITAEQALAHPWLAAHLGFAPTPSRELPGAVSNIVEFHAPHGAPLSPRRSSGAAGPLSPQASSPLRAVLSGELPPPSCVVAEQPHSPLRAAVPVLVPAAE